MRLLYFVQKTDYVKWLSSCSFKWAKSGFRVMKDFEIKKLSGFLLSVVDDSQISLRVWYRRHPIAAIQLAVSCSELYFACCCALKRTGTFASERKDTCLI